MSIFRASINIATTSHSLEQLNEHAGVEATRWAPIGSPVHDFDPTGPLREISQWHYDAPVDGGCVGAPTQQLDHRLGVLLVGRDDQQRVAAAVAGVDGDARVDHLAQLAGEAAAGQIEDARDDLPAHAVAGGFGSIVP